MTTPIKFDISISINYGKITAATKHTQSTSKSRNKKISDISTVNNKKIYNK